MRGYLLSSTLYKGIILVVFLLIVIEYLFGTVTESTNFVLNSTNFRRRETIRHIKVNRTKNENVGNNTEYMWRNTSLLWPVNNLSQIADESDLKLPPCPEDPPDLVGVVPIIRYPVPSVSELENRFYWLKPGGHYAPETCRVDKKVAIVIPFRNRGEHLLLFLQHMHPFLRRQQLDYTIFIVEQDGNGPFNRALLMNVGYIEALRRRNYNCFIFHDIDLLPENDRNLYTCPIQPRHMSVAVDSLKYQLPYRDIFGGVSAISTEHFRLLNGFSNSFWGWGGEDDDMSNRIRHHKLFISRYPPTIARYTMLTHAKNKPSPNRYDMLKSGQQKFDKDGLNSLRYEAIKFRENLLYTWILVRVEVPS